MAKDEPVQGHWRIVTLKRNAKGTYGGVEVTLAPVGTVQPLRLGQVLTAEKREK